MLIVGWWPHPKLITEMLMGVYSEWWDWLEQLELTVKENQWLESQIENYVSFVGKFNQGLFNWLQTALACPRDQGMSYCLGQALKPVSTGQKKMKYPLWDKKHFI